MRLSLKTLLAYKDHLFDEEYQPVLQQRITEQDSAESLLQRISIVSHDKQLGAPGRNGESEELPANIVAAYLDHKLVEEEAYQFEMICLQSDVFLAETVCVHEILATILGEPAQISRECRLRLYAIPTFYQSKNTQTVENSPKIEVQKAENKSLTSPESSVANIDQQPEPDIKQQSPKKHRIVVQHSNKPPNTEAALQQKNEEQQTHDVSVSQPVIASFSKQESRIRQAFEKWERRRQLFAIIAVFLLFLIGGIVFYSFRSFQTDETPQLASLSSSGNNVPPPNDRKTNTQRINEHAAIWKDSSKKPEENQNESPVSPSGKHSAESVNYFPITNPIYTLPEPPSQVAKYLPPSMPQDILPNLAAEILQTPPTNTSSTQNSAQDFTPLPPKEEPLFYAALPSGIPQNNPPVAESNISIPVVFPEQPLTGTVHPSQEGSYVSQNPSYSAASLLSATPSTPAVATAPPIVALGTDALFINNQIPPTASIMSNAPIIRNSDTILPSPSVTDSNQVSIQIHNRGNVQSISQSMYQTLPAVQPAISAIPNGTRLPETTLPDNRGTPDNTGNLRNPQQRSGVVPYRNGTTQQIPEDSSIQQVAYHDHIIDELQVQPVEHSSEDVRWNEIKDGNGKKDDSNMVSNNNNNDKADAFEQIPLITPLQAISANEISILQNIGGENRIKNKETPVAMNPPLPPIRQLHFLAKGQGQIAAEIFLANDDLALIRETSESNWVWLPVSKPLYQDIILVPAPFRAAIHFSNGIVIETEGDTRIRILPTDEWQIPSVAFDCGHLTISAKGESNDPSELQLASRNAEAISAKIRIITPVGSGILRLADRNSFVSINSENKTAIKLLRVMREYQSVTENPQFYHANLKENVVYCPNLLAFPVQGGKIFWRKETLSSGSVSNQTDLKNQEEWELGSLSIFPLDAEKSIAPILIADSHNLLIAPNVAWPSLTSHDGKIPITKLNLKNQFITMPETFFPTPSKTWLLK
ncbi:MAG: hypothetical protein LBJ67_13710 [Planctomycetaceae bacterium]|nr:hypothetical protein [Planctomycetaceae bacterium]